MSLYFILLTVSLLVPLSLSFDKNLRFYKTWGRLFPAIIITAGIYIAFDVYFTREGFWGFNSMYLSGIKIINLPIEEWLFFLVIPYSSVFLHASFVLYFPKTKLSAKATKGTTLLIAVLFLALAVFNFGKAYTFYISIKTLLILAVAYFFARKTLSHYYITFLIIIVPFIIVNGILTGSFIVKEVVWYNDFENLGIRFFTIPVEDFIYAFGMLLLSIVLMQFFKKNPDK